MAFAWRLVDPRFAQDLQGTGNRIRGARWNSPGRGVLYCSENLSLCVLETFVHLNLVMRERLPPRTAVHIEFPDDTKIMDIATLPDTARAERCRAIGDKWLDQGNALILQAPSVVVPLERNLMFNPQHTAMKNVRIVELIAFEFDERMMQR